MNNTIKESDKQESTDNLISDFSQVEEDKLLITKRDHSDEWCDREMK